MLANAPSEPEASPATAAFGAAMLSLIGRFDLDPNRALDLVLHVLEQRPHNALLLALVPRFHRSSVVAVLGFRFLQYQPDFWQDTCPPQSGNPAPAQSTTIATSKLGKPVPPPEPAVSGVPLNGALVSGSAPRSLYVLAGLLIAHGLVELEELLPYLSPSPGQTVDLAAQREAARRREVARLGVVSLGSSSKDKDRPEEPPESRPVAVAGFAEGNQLLGLLHGLLSARCWLKAADVASYIQTGGAFDPFSCAEVCSALAELVTWLMAPIYAPASYAHLGLGCEWGSSMGEDSPVVGRVPGGAPSQVCQLGPDDQVDGLFPHLLRSLLGVLGPRVGRSPSLFTRICRLARLEAKRLSDVGEPLRGSYLFVLVQESLLPGLTLAPCSPALSFALWEVLSLLPFDLRFPLYSGWREDGMGRKDLDSKGCERAEAEERQLLAARGHLKRLAKENIKSIGRLIGRHTHSYPLIVFSHMLNQIEAYENLIPYVVDALKYSTPLTRDVLAYALLGQLESSSRERLKQRDTHYSQWFVSLAKFIASFFRRYPSTEIRGLLHLLLRRLSAGQSLDLLILQELLAKMGGCETVLELSYAQLDGMAGGRTLRGEVMASSLAESVSKKAVARLREELVESGVALPLVVLISQVRQRILFQSECDELKLLSHLHDSAQDVLMQFADFLISSETSVETMARLMPPLPVLSRDMGLSVPVAFTLVRPLIRAALAAGPLSSDAPAHLQEWHPLSDTMLTFAKSHLPAAALKLISPQLWTLFWSLSVYDLSTPSARYATEKARVVARIAQLAKKPDLPPKARKQELARLSSLAAELQEELEAQKRHSDAVYRLLLGMKETLFLDAGAASQIIDCLLRHCIKDRITLSPADAVFCSQFFLLLHRADTPLFSTVLFIDRIVNTALPMLFACTEYEAGFIGYGISHLLGIANKWVANKAIYDVEAMSKNGMFDPSTKAKVDYSRFKTKFRAWHSRIHDVSVACLGSKEYIHIRAALIFLTKVTSSQQYPTLAKDGRLIISSVAKLESSEQRADLQVMARSLSALLQRQSKDWTDDKGIKPLTGRTSVPPAAAASSTKSAPTSEVATVSRAGLLVKAAPEPSNKPEVQHLKAEVAETRNVADRFIKADRRNPTDGRGSSRDSAEVPAKAEDNVRRDQDQKPHVSQAESKSGSASGAGKRKIDDVPVEASKRRRSEDDKLGRSNSGGKDKAPAVDREEPERTKRPRESEQLDPVGDGAPQGKARSGTKDLTASDRRFAAGSQREQDHRGSSAAPPLGRAAAPLPSGRHPRQGTSHAAWGDSKQRAPLPHQPPPPKVPPPIASDSKHADGDKSSRRSQRN